MDVVVIHIRGKEVRHLSGYETVCDSVCGRPLLSIRMCVCQSECPTPCPIQRCTFCVGALSSHGFHWKWRMRRMDLLYSALTLTLRKRIKQAALRAVGVSQHHKMSIIWKARRMAPTSLPNKHPSQRLQEYAGLLQVGGSPIAYYS